jgi:hypothetical protein
MGGGFVSITSQTWWLVFVERGRNNMNAAVATLCCGGVEREGVDMSHGKHKKG